MSLENELDNDAGGSDFDFDAGVADIADGLGLGGGSDAETELDTEVNHDDPSQLPQDQNKTEEEKAAEEQQQQQPAVREPPKSWAKEQHELWGQIPDAAKDYIEQREKQMADGMNGAREAFSFINAYDQAVSPYREDFQAAGVDEITGIRSLMEHHRAITQGTLEQRQQAFIQIGIASGLIPQEGQPQVDPRTQHIEQRLAQIERQTQQREQQIRTQQEAQMLSEIQGFASEHEYFDLVADDMMPYLYPGMPISELKVVYDKAVWANPATRAKEMQKQMTAETERRRQEAEAAKKAASANVRGQQRPRTADVPGGSWDDTMEEALRAIKNR
jgi:hypothetical protein